MRESIGTVAFRTGGRHLKFQKAPVINSDRGGGRQGRSHAPRGRNQKFSQPRIVKKENRQAIDFELESEVIAHLNRVHDSIAN